MVSTGTFLHKVLVFIQVFVKVHSNITGYHPSNLSAIVAGTWKMGRWHNESLSPNTKIDFRKLLAIVQGLLNSKN